MERKHRDSVQTHPVLKFSSSTISSPWTRLSNSVSTPRLLRSLPHSLHFRLEHFAFGRPAEHFCRELPRGSLPGRNSGQKRWRIHYYILLMLLWRNSLNGDPMHAHTTAASSVNDNNLTEENHGCPLVDCSNLEELLSHDHWFST